MVKHYFFIRNFNNNIAGIESATKKRLQLFLEMGEDAVIATSSRNDFLQQIVEKHSIPYRNVIDMYRYYQKPTKPVQPYTLQLLKQQQATWRFDKINHLNDYRVYDQHGVYIMYLACLEDEQVHYMNFFDVNRKKFKRLIYDEFGNASREILLDANQKVICERFFNDEGRVCIEEHYTVNDKQKWQQLIVETDYKK